MSYSLNEVEAMARKATRGAGHEWGVAEDAAKAVRWLCAQGIDGVAALSAVLMSEERGAACPLLVGLELADRAARLREVPFKGAHLAHPVLLLPFAAMAARQVGRTVWIDCDGADAVTDGHFLAVTGEFPPYATRVNILVEGVLTAPLPRQTRARPNPEAWAALGHLAHKTYAPATEESRLRGAGAGLSDND
jgi:hypothetical protein